jgi:hypothetical protein
MTCELTPDAIELGLHAALAEVFRLDFGEFGRVKRGRPPLDSGTPPTAVRGRETGRRRLGYSKLEPTLA